MQKKEKTVERVSYPSEDAISNLNATISKEENTDDETVATIDEGVDEKKGKDKEKRLAIKSDREKIRVLLISTDRNIFVEGSRVRKRIISYGKLFNELHVIVYSLHEHNLEDARLANNVWIYPTSSRSRLLYIYDAYRIAGKQLSFASGFRVDLISAQDPFESGIAGYLIARRRNRTLQLQLHTDPLEPYFVKSNDLNKWRLLIAQFLLPRAHCIRVVSAYLKEKIEKRFPRTVGKIDVLPVFSDLSRLRDMKPTFNLHERYPKLKFIILMASRITKEKNIGFAIDVCAHTLKQYPTVGLVIVGDGPEKEKLQKKVSDMNLHKRVVFEPWQEDIASHLKTANLFLSTSSYEGYGRTLVEAAAAGLPVLTSNVGVAEELFEDGVNGFVCPLDDAACFSARIGEFLSNNQLRRIFSINARDKVFNMVESNIDSYFLSYQEGMERCVLTHDAVGKK